MSEPLTPETVADAQLPQLAALLDAAQMGAHFARALPIPYLTDCQIIRVKYRSHRNCCVTYRLRLLDPRTGEMCEQTVSALALRPGESRAYFNYAQQQVLVPTVLGRGVFHLPELETVGWVFPNDRKLAGLPNLTNVAQLQREILPPIVAASFGAQWQLSELKPQVVHYVAERSCTVRADLELTHGRTGETMRRTIFGKTYCPGEDARAWQAITQLWQSEACQQGRLLIPQPLLHQPTRRTCWQRGLSGATLGAPEAARAASKLQMTQAGAAVAALHGVPLSDLRAVKKAEKIAQLQTAMVMIIRAHPEFESVLPLLVMLLIVSAHDADAPVTATLHGDLHLQNLLVSDGRVALLDLDDLHRGDPLQDLGSFAAALHYRRLLGHANAATTTRQINQFIAAYRSSVDWEVTASALAWHTMAALLTERAYRCVTRLKAGRQALLNEIIALIQRLSKALG